jgi:hypothetical protein
MAKEKQLNWTCNFIPGVLKKGKREERRRVPTNLMGLGLCNIHGYDPFLDRWANSQPSSKRNLRATFHKLIKTNEGAILIQSQPAQSQRQLPLRYLFISRRITFHIIVWGLLLLPKLLWSSKN